MAVSGNNFIKREFTSLVRGGRMIKYKGKAVSLAPGMIMGVSDSPQEGVAPCFSATMASLAGRLKAQLAMSVSFRALSMRGLMAACAVVTPMAMTVTGANAGTCTETAPGTGVFVCADPAGADTTQYINHVGGGTLDVSTDPSFGITTAAGSAVRLIKNSGSNLVFTDANASTITGSNSGVEVANRGNGYTSITTTGTVTGTRDWGVIAFAYGSGLTIDTQGAVWGGRDGVYTRNYGSGSTSITTQAVTGASGYGIVAYEYGASLTIDAQGDVYGRSRGILARSNGSGALSITTQAVTANIAGGIYATNSNYGTSLTIYTQGDVNSRGAGINASNYGSGALTIAADGDVTSTNSNGINVYNSAVSSSSMQIYQGANSTITGLFDGIRAYNRGGSLTINALGSTVGQFADGIHAHNGADATDLSITANRVRGYYNGINALNDGTGAISITTTGDVYGRRAIGINAVNFGNGTSLTIGAQGGVYGKYGNAINASSFGSGALTITASADVESGAGNGINAYNSAVSTSSMQINQGADSTITGEFNGIYGYNSGGSLTINALGSIVGNVGNGINVFNGLAATDLSITANDVSGFGIGVLANNRGTGAASVTTTGDVSGYAVSGIYAINSQYGSSLTINAQGAVTGGTTGIQAFNSGSDAMSITTQSVTGQTGHGLAATNYGTSLTLGAHGAVYGELSGIDVRNNGSGAMSVTTQSVFGYAGNGLNAINAGTSLNINALGTVFGEVTGISANNAGSEALSITTQAVTGVGSSGIFASNAGTSLTIDAQDAVSGGIGGISASNSGSGALSITSKAVSGTVATGISASNSSSGTSLTIDAQGTVYGGRTAIVARNRGTGALSIATQVADATNGYTGIAAFNYGTSLTINAQGAVTGGIVGINAYNRGSGATSITTQAVTGISSFGIEAGSRNATSMTIDAQGAVYGGITGISAVKSGGTDAMSITTQAVTGFRSSGISAKNWAGSSLTINAQGTVLGRTNGITAFSFGNGATSITTQAVTGQENAGIDVLGGSNSTSLTIDAQGDVTGATAGIAARNDGSGILSITSQAAVTGGTGFGIETATGAGGQTEIILNAGAAVSSAAGGGIHNDAGNSATTVNAGASVAGIISLGDGSDDLTFAGGDFSAVTLFDGGDDSSIGDGFIDTLAFIGSSGGLLGANVMNWENVEIRAGSTIYFADNALSTDVLSIHSGGTLNTTLGALAFSSNVVNNGTIDAVDGAANDSINVSGDYSGGGLLRLDVDFETDTADTLTIGGNVTGGATTISLNALGAFTTSNDVMLVQVAGTSSADDFALAGPVAFGNLRYVLAQVGNHFVLRAQGFTSSEASFEVMPQVLLRLNALPTLHQRMPGQFGASDDDEVSRGATNTNETSQIWARVEGSHANVASGVSTTGSSYDLNQWKIRSGFDLIVNQGQAGTFVVGVNGYYGAAGADVSSPTGNGTINTEGYGVGLTATWYGNSGYYVDAQAQLSWFSSDVTDANLGALTSGNKGTGEAFSLEAGKRIGLSNGWNLTPQAQLTYSSVNFDGFTGLGAVVSLDEAQSLTGRFGVDMERVRASTGATGVSSRLYASANLYYDFSGTSQVNVSGNDFINTPDNFSGELAIGGSYDWANQYSVYGELSAATSLENFGDSSQFKGTVGLSVAF